jgi:hypothetical protein
MKGKILVAVGLMLVLMVGLVPGAQADELEGIGHIWAKGIGYAEIHGRGVVDISAQGVGTVMVKSAEVLRAQGQGRRWDLPDGTVLFAGWRGHIHAEGQGLSVKMLGGIIEFAAAGEGSVFLKGAGHYRLNGQPGVWPRDGFWLELRPACS